MEKVRVVKRAVTLIEMIVVMILIATITGAVAYNYRKSLNEGRAFRTKEGIERIETVVALYYAEHPEMAKDIKDIGTIENIARHSPLVKNSKEFVRDGWGELYQIQPGASEEEIIVTSRKYEQYKKEKEGSKSH